MTFIAATEEQMLTVTAAPDQVYAFFAQPRNLCDALGSVERCDVLPDGRVHWVLAEKVDQGIRFQGDYVVTWAGDGAEHVGWRFVEGNMRNEGDVWLRATPAGGTEIRYREVVEPDLPVTPLMARLIRPLVVRELRREIARFLEHVRLHFSN
jgi:uncharacterized membrane protein